MSRHILVLALALAALGGAAAAGRRLADSCAPVTCPQLSADPSSPLEYTQVQSLLAAMLSNYSYESQSSLDNAAWEAEFKAELKSNLLSGSSPSVEFFHDSTIGTDGAVVASGDNLWIVFRGESQQLTVHPVCHPHLTRAAPLRRHSAGCAHSDAVRCESGTRKHDDASIHVGRHSVRAVRRCSEGHPDRFVPAAEDGCEGSLQLPLEAGWQAAGLAARQRWLAAAPASCWSISHRCGPGNSSQRCTPTSLMISSGLAQCPTLSCSTDAS